MVLYLGNKLSRHGNTPTSVETLGALLAKEIDIVTVSDKKNKLLRLVDMLGSILKYRKQVNLVLMDTYSTSNFYYALLSALLCRLFGIAYIPILHGGSLPVRLEDNPYFCNMIFRYSRTNVAPSGYLYDAFMRSGFSVEYIPNSIDIAAYDFLERKKVRPRLLYVRAFSELYNPMMALDVVARLKEKYPDVELCMVGPDRDGTLEKTKEKCQEMGLENHVRFMGKMEKREWHALSREYDIFINTTNVDNTPVSLIEAMALGLPIVTTNVGGISYLVEDGVDALTVASGDAEAMCQKIEWLLGHPENALTLAKNARKKAESFDWGNIRDKWMQLLKKEDN